jgi:hypothetical protein
LQNIFLPNLHDFFHLSIRTEEQVKEKIDLLGVLGDIEIAQALIKGTDDKQAGLDEVDHPLDANYKILNTDMVYLDPSEPENKDELDYIERYTANTQGRKKTSLHFFSFHLTLSSPH